MENAPVKPGDVIAGKFVVERLLGEGGMGVVVAAMHRELEQRVAVKFLLPEIAKRDDAAERFRREARAAVKIRSEHVARVLDVGTEGNVPYMVMEYLEGNDLGDELKARGPLPIAEAVGWLLEACEAVAEAHASGIVHRDLKPANLFLARRADGTRLVKVLDFGISKSVTGSSAADLSLTATSALIGSPLYMSPEQMHSAKNVDTRTDIWALGAILYQLLADRPPYVAESIPQLCSALLNDQPPPLASLRNEIPEELASVIAKALAKDRELRWQSVGDLCLALLPFAPGAKVHAERAARLVSVMPRVPLAEASSEPKVAKSRSVASNLEDQPTEASVPPPERTLDSWGKTGSARSSPPQKGSRPIAALVAGGLVAVLLVGWGISRSTAVATPSATPAGEPPRPAPVETAATAPGPAIAVEPAKVEPKPEASASDAGSSSPAPTAKRAAGAASPPSKPSEKPSSAPFGGRR